jgi:hypothetical protein
MPPDAQLEFDAVARVSKEGGAATDISTGGIAALPGDTAFATAHVIDAAAGDQINIAYGGRFGAEGVAALRQPWFRFAVNAHARVEIFPALP